MSWRHRDQGADAARRGLGSYTNPYDRQPPGRMLSLSDDSERRRNERDWDDGHRSETRRIEEEQRKKESDKKERERQERQRRERAADDAAREEREREEQEQAEEDM